MSDKESDNDSIASNELKIEEDNENLERKEIRTKLSTMSFEELLKLKEEMGSKLYNQTVLNIDTKKTKTSFKRANKNRPREMSSKIKFQHKAFINNSNSVEKIAPIKKAAARDPRFDPMCGNFDKKIFKNNYKFVNDLRKQEKKQLEQEYKNTSNVDRKRQIKFLIQRIGNQIREEDRKNKEDSQDFEEKKQIREKLNRGEKPEYKKKSVKKLESLIIRYEELKSENKLEKHIKKKSAKQSKKIQSKINEIAN